MDKPTVTKKMLKELRGALLSKQNTSDFVSQDSSVAADGQKTETDDAIEDAALARQDQQQR